MSYFLDSLFSLLSTSVATAMSIMIKGDYLTNQEPHHGPVHRVPSQPGLCHQRGVHCGLGNVSLEPADVVTSMSQLLRMKSLEEKIFYNTKIEVTKPGATMPSTSTASPAGSRLARFGQLNFRPMNHH